MWLFLEVDADDRNQRPERKSNEPLTDPRDSEPESLSMPGLVVTRKTDDLIPFCHVALSHVTRQLPIARCCSGTAYETRPDRMAHHIRAQKR